MHHEHWKGNFWWNLNEKLLYPLIGDEGESELDFLGMATGQSPAQAIEGIEGRFVR